MKLELFHIDAFAEQMFQGNPAAVCLLDDWLPDAIMQAIAGELNLSETAFCVKRSDGDYRIRWFTPTTEVKLCGHATLASAHVLYEHMAHPKAPIRFHSLSGPLVTQPRDAGIALDLPVQPVDPIAVTTDIRAAINADIQEVYAGEDLVVLLSDASEVAIFEPDFPRLAQLPYRGICISAPGNGNGYDFVSRFFAPQSGINEDPVTGSSYTKLAPIYALKLGKTEFKARQISSRGGDVNIILLGDRVTISGNAQTVLRSILTLPEY